MYYIKIKHLKQFLLIVACLFFASLNYFTYAKNNDTSSQICNKNSDSDCDGLTNAEEKLYGTNSKSADTDKDGYSDSVEIKSGYDPLKAAPGDKIETGKSVSAQKNISKENTRTLTENYIQGMVEYFSSKNGQEVSTTDLSVFADELVTKYAGDQVTWETLPVIDRSQIKILEQNYSGLSDKKREEKKLEDSTKYLNQLIYLIASNLPKQMESPEDFQKFVDDFYSKLAGLSESSKDVAYFSDLGDRLEAFVNQAADIEVPETMVDLHIKFFRILKGILTLKDQTFSSSDPMGQVAIVNKASAYTEMFGDFFKNDFSEYFNSISVSE